MPETLNFQTACKIGNVAVVARLIEERDKSPQAPVQWEQDLRDGLVKAARNDHRAVVALLLSRGAELSESAFIASTSRVAVFEEFLDHGFDINSTEFRGEPALRLAVSDIETLKWMLRHGADPNVKNSRGATPLATAVIMDKPLEAQLLLDHGAAVEPHLIHRALRAASGVGESMFRLLVEAGVDINYDSPEYGTPLHLAAYDGDKDTVEMLLRLGANPNIAVRDHAGEAFTPAELAKRQGNDDICDLLNAAAALS